MMVKKLIAKLESSLRERFPDAQVTVDAPEQPSHPWFVDVQTHGREFVIEYRSAIGFGLSSVQSNLGLGSGPDEIYLKEDGVIDRIAELVESGSHTEPTATKLLQELRAMLGVTQAELAQKIGIRQPTISKMERHVGGMSFDTLQRYVRALGGEVRVVADVKGQVFEILAERFDSSG